MPMKAWGTSRASQTDVKTLWDSDKLVSTIRLSTNMDVAFERREAAIAEYAY